MRLALVTLLAALAVALSAHAARPDPREAIITRFVAQTGFNGVVLLGRGDRVELVKTFGFADAGKRRPVTAGTRFEAGSISKWVASLVVLRLVDQKKLDLDAPISTYLPNYRADNGARLTLRLLMSHSSGVPNQVQAARDADPAIRGVDMPIDQAVRRYASGDLAFAPGTAWDYSHSNWILVKAIVERASGKTYEQLVRSEVLQPAGLRDSGLYTGDSSKTPGMAVGYSALTPKPEVRTNPMPKFMAMVGGFYSTAPDMLKLMNKVYSGGLLSRSSLKAFTTVLMPDQHYALGGRYRLKTYAGRERTVSSQDGSNGAYRMFASRVLDDGVTVILLNNTSFDQEAMAGLVDQLLLASYPEAP
ncbi:MAG: Beta-lactamase [Caulobacteraceae bacterium]|nr:Beta-lactamase [Caulobacteraceae bacterium]